MYLIWKVMKQKIFFVSAEVFFKGAIMKIEKALINDSVRVSEVLRKFCIPTIYNFAEFTSDYFLTVSILLSVYKQNFTAQ